MISHDQPLLVMISTMPVYSTINVHVDLTQPYAEIGFSTLAKLVPYTSLFSTEMLKPFVN